MRRWLGLGAAGLRVIAAVGAITLASCGGTSDRVPMVSYNSAAESGQLYADCVQAVTTKVTSLPVFSRKRLLMRYRGPGPTVAFSHPAPSRGARLGAVYGVPMVVRRATVRHLEPGGVNPVTVVSHIAHPAMVAGYLRCEGYRRQAGAGAGVSWSRSSPSRSFVRSLPGAVVAGGQAADVDRVAARLATKSPSVRVDAATTAAAGSGASFVTARMVKGRCSVGRWAEQTAPRRVRLHFLLNRRAQRAPKLAVARRPAVVRTSRVSNELRVDVRSAAATHVALEFAGDAIGEWTAFALSC